MTSRTPKGSARSGKVPLKISKSLFRPTTNSKLVTFDPVLVAGEGEEMVMGTPSSEVSDKGTKRPNGTPHSRVTSTENKNRPVPAKRPRTKKKTSLQVFSSANTVRARPQLTLNAQETFAKKSLQSKLLALRKETKICSIDRLDKLTKVEDDMMKRFGMVRTLKLKNGDDQDEEDLRELEDRKDAVISLMADKLEALQTYIEKTKSELDQEREQLRVKHKKYICCGVCFAQKKALI